MRMVLRLDHVSIAVNDYVKADAFFRKLLGLVPGGAGRDDSLKFMFQVYSAGDLSRFELIAPSGKKSFLDNFLSGREGGVHHITFQVDDILAAREQLDKENIRYFGFNDSCENWKELFIHPSDAFGVLIQFAEFNPHEWIDESMSVKGPGEWDVKKSGDKAVLSILHPGGGRVDSGFTAQELDLLINDLVKIRAML